MTAIEIIRLRQKMGLSKFGIDEDEWKEEQARSDEDLIALMMKNRPGDMTEEEIRATLRNDQRVPPTDLQEAGNYRIVKDRLDLCIKTAKHLKQWEEVEPIIATEFAGEINGYCFSDNQDQAGIVLDSTLLTFTHLISKILAQAIQTIEGESVNISWDKEAVKNRIIQDPELFGRFSELLTAYIVDGNPSYATPYFMKDPSYDKVITRLRDGMQLFIVAHECGHIFNKDLEDEIMNRTTDPLSLSQPLDEKTFVYQYRHNREHMADLYGFNIVANGIGFKDPTSIFSMWGPFIFFNCLHLLDTSLFFAAYGRSYLEEQSDAMGFTFSKQFLPTTHPDPYLRRKVLLDNLAASNFPDDVKKIVTSFDESLQNVFLHLQEAWEGTISKGQPLQVHQRWNGRIEEFNTYIELGKGLLKMMQEKNDQERLPQ